MNKLISSVLIFIATLTGAFSQEYFDITLYNVNVKVNQDASLDIDETIDVHFNEARHGIFRKIPFQYPIQQLPAGNEKAHRQMESGGYTKTMVIDIDVDGWDYSVSTEGDYKVIKIGSKKKYVDGDQQFKIHYRILNAINFFKDHSEFYFNIIGDGWPTSIGKVNYTVSLSEALPEIPAYFIASGPIGSKENNTVNTWNGTQQLVGNTTVSLASNEGVTVGITFPSGYLTEPNFFYYGVQWMIFPCLVLVIMFLIWRKWGKDDDVTIQTEFYPPAKMSPSVAGYIIDDKLDKRDLTALIPYWGGGGYLQIKEVEKSALMGFSKNTEYEFIKLKELPENSLAFERTLFNGIFSTGDAVMLSSLKNVLYTTMESSKAQLEAEVDKEAYYVEGSRGWGMFFLFLGIALAVYGVFLLISGWGGPIWHALAFIVSGPIILFFGTVMAKKSKKGTLLYQKLAGFKEFIQKVEQDKLKEFLKQDENYIDKVLPFAIVFDVADAWKDKLKGLEIPPPNWYVGNYTGFTTYMFLNSLDRSMNQMSESFYSAPSSSGTSGGSFSGGGGGFSGGGFGGGGGGSW